MFSILLLLAFLSFILWFYFFFTKKPLTVTPRVPVVSGRLPFIGCGIDFIKNPKQFLLACIKQHGETFQLHLFGFDLIFTFSREGLAALYQIRENEASFTEATRTLLQLKLPPEATSGSMTMFHRGFRKRLFDGYLFHIDNAIATKLSELDTSTNGTFEIFSFMKELVHRIGFLCWVGQEAARVDYLRRFVADFEELDPEKGFQNLASLSWTLLSRKRNEYRALKDMEDVLKEIWLEREKRGERVDDNLTSLHEMYADLSEAERYRKVALNVFQFHLASQANTYAALSWTFINVLQHRRLCDEGLMRDVTRADGRTLDVDVLDEMNFVDDVVDESLRLAQQSITLRKVVRECQFEKYRVPKGIYLATLLSITNSAVAESEKSADEFWPFRRRRDPFDTRVSTFGHGFHACPGRRFALAIVKVFLVRALTRFDFTPQFREVCIPPGSVGAVARASHPCVVEYRVKEQ